MTSEPRREPETGDLGDEWVVLKHPTAPVRFGKVPSHPALVARLVAAAAVVSLIIGTLAFFVSNRLAEQDTLAEGVRISDILSSEVTSALNEASSEEQVVAVETLDRGVLPAMNRFGVRRVKVFAPSGLVLYSDEHRLIGQTFQLGEIEMAALASDEPLAEVSTPEGAEDQFEKVPGRLIEVRQRLTAADGSHALLEVYLDYAIVGQRATQMWRAFLILLVGSLVLLTTMVIPVALQLLRRVDEGTQHREELLQRAVDASALERRRIAGSLHDGPVQELVGNTLALTTTADALDQAHQPAAAANVRTAAGAVRRTVGSLRSLLVDLYPASLDEQGLQAALRDLLDPLRARGIGVSLTVTADNVPTVDEQLIYRVSQELTRNIASHSGATAVGIRLESDTAWWRLIVSDNGHGFDPRAVLDGPRPGHFGLRIVADLADAAGAGLRVTSGPDGTSWELTKELT